MKSSLIVIFNTIMVIYSISNSVSVPLNEYSYPKKKSTPICHYKCTLLSPLIRGMYKAAPLIPCGHFFSENDETYRWKRKFINLLSSIVSFLIGAGNTVFLTSATILRSKESIASPCWFMIERIPSSLVFRLG